MTEKVSKMAKLISLAAREVVVNLHGQGLSMRQIALQENVNYGAVKRLISRYKTEGEKGLIPKYDQCGPKRSYESELSYR